MGEVFSVLTEDHFNLVDLDWWKEIWGNCIIVVIIKCAPSKIWKTISHL